MVIAFEFLPDISVYGTIVQHFQGLLLYFRQSNLNPPVQGSSLDH